MSPEIGAWIVGVAMGLLVGFFIGVRRAPARHAAAALAAASNDSVKLTRYAWNQAAVEAKRGGFAELPAKPWEALSSVQRDVIHRISEATVEVIVREVEHRAGERTA